MNRYHYLIFIVLISGSFNVFAQSPDRTDIETDTTETPKTSLTLATIYANDASYYGQASTERLPYVLGYASLSFPNGFFLAGGAYKLINYGSGISGVDLSAGYDFKL